MVLIETDGTTSLRQMSNDKITSIRLCLGSASWKIIGFCRYNGELKKVLVQPNMHVLPKNEVATQLVKQFVWGPCLLVCPENELP